MFFKTIKIFFIFCQFYGKHQSDSASSRHQYTEKNLRDIQPSFLRKAQNNEDFTHLELMSTSAYQVIALTE